MGAIASKPLRRTVTMARKAAIIAAQSRDQRQRLRRKLGTLEINLVRKFTVERYTECFNNFIRYLAQTRGVWPTSNSQYDLLVSEYLESLWDEGEPKSIATYTLASLHYFLPQLRRCLNRSWKLKATWDKLELPCQAIPLDIDTLMSFVGFFFIRQRDAAMGLACIVAFNALLRTGEILSLLVANCHRTSDGFVLILTQTKGGQRRILQDESVLVDDTLTVWALEQLIRNKQPGDYVVSLSPATFRTRWNHMKRYFKLTDFRYLPYSLRRGGATWFFQNTGSFSQTMMRGRWQHLKTCKLYVSEAQIALAALTLPESTQSQLQHYRVLIRPHLLRWASQVRMEGHPF